MLARLARVRPRAPLVGVRPAWVHTRLCAVLQPPQPLLALLHPHLPPVLDPFSQLPAGGCDLSLPTAAEHISPLTFGGIAIGARKFPSPIASNYQPSCPPPPFPARVLTSFPVLCRKVVLPSSFRRCCQKLPRHCRPKEAKAGGHINRMC